MIDTPVRSAGHQLRDQAATLAGEAVACAYGRYPTLRARFGPAGRTRSRQDAVYHFSHLADALDVNSPALFNDHVGWVKVLLKQRGVPSEDLDHYLVCMAEVVRAEMPSWVADPAVAMIEGALSLLPAMPSTTISLLDSEDRLAPLACEYVHQMLGGYRNAAGRLAFEAVERGESVRHLYLQVFQPALREIGRLWQINKINVAQEHFCSAATQVVMAQLLSRADTAERCGRCVVVACVSGDLHELGARMIGDFFDMAGWDTYFCGANTPHEACIQSVVERAADVLAVSATMGYHLHAVQDLIQSVRFDPRCAKLHVMVGGYPFTVDPALWRTVGADGTAPDANAAVALAEQWEEGLRP
ncbi:MAG: cobalamin-dependent protein [Caldimonas sp.]